MVLPWNLRIIDKCNNLDLTLMYYVKWNQIIYLFILTKLLHRLLIFEKPLNAMQKQELVKKKKPVINYIYDQMVYNICKITKTTKNAF